MRSLTCRLPFTTTGLCFCVNDLFHRFQTSLSKACTIHQFFRYSLVQFELKCFKVHQKHYEFYPHLDCVTTVDKNLRGLIKEMESYKNNFGSIVDIINTYGFFYANYQNFCTILPPSNIHSPHTVRISNLRAIVNELSAGVDKEFVKENTLPGAIYNASGVLLNADSIMPAEYDVDKFREDASAVLLALKELDPAEETFHLADCTFSEDGLCSALISTDASKVVDCDRIPPIRQHDDAVVFDYNQHNFLPTSTFERIWYSIQSINCTNEEILRYGMLTYCGVWSDKLAKKWPDLNVRYPGSSKSMGAGCWSTAFNVNVSEEQRANYKTLYSATESYYG